MKKMSSGENSYYIETETGTVVGHLLECGKCKRKVLVEMHLFGTVHHHQPSVVCADCLTINDKFAPKQPEIVKQIKEWMIKSQS